MVSADARIHLWLLETPMHGATGINNAPVNILAKINGESFVLTRLLTVFGLQESGICDARTRS
jgi:hypothetical protein